MSAKLDACYAAMRVAFEEHGLTSEQLSRISSKPVRGIMARAEREGWNSPAETEPSDRQRLERARSKLIGEIEKLALRRRRKTDDERERIECLSTVTRTLAKVAGTLPAQEAPIKDSKNRDAEIAAALKRINERIVELAKHHAVELARRHGVELGADECFSGPGPAADA